MTKKGGLASLPWQTAMFPLQCSFSLRQTSQQRTRTTREQTRGLCQNTLPSGSLSRGKRWTPGLHKAAPSAHRAAEQIAPLCVQQYLGRVATLSSGRKQRRRRRRERLESCEAPRWLVMAVLWRRSLPGFRGTHLHTVEGSDTHVEEHTVEHRHGNELWGKEQKKPSE